MDTNSPAKIACGSVSATTKATGSPTNRTTSRANGKCSGVKTSKPLGSRISASGAPLHSALCGIGFIPSALKSLPDSTAKTPGDINAFEISIDFTLACA